MFKGVLIEKFISILDPKDFFSKFREDLKGARKEVIIFSPYIEPKSDGYKWLIKDIKDAAMRGVNIKVVAREGIDKEKVKELIQSGVTIYTRKTHVKAAIIDEKIIYIGSLNMLSSWLHEDIMVRITGITGKIIPKIVSKSLFEKISIPSEKEKLD